MSDPFSNPFASASNEPVEHTGTVGHTIPAGRSPPVMSQALPPRTANVASAAPLRPNLTAAYHGPVSRETTGSIDTGPVRSAPGASFGGWTSSGGVPVTVSEGETADVLSKRYGVPATALLQTNGLRSASDLRPGQQVTIPVYNAVAASARPVAPVAAVEPVRSVPRAAPAARAAVAEPVRHLAKASLLQPKAGRTTAAAAAPLRAAPTRVAAAPPAAPAPVTTKGAIKDRHLAAADPHHRQATAPQQAAAPVRTATASAVVTKPAVKTAKAAAAVAAAPVRTATAVPVPAKPAPVRMASLEPAVPVAAAAPTRQPDPPPTASTAPAAPVTDAAGTPEFRWPAHGRIIQGFKGGNDGINIAVPEGTSVKAAESGTVAYAGSELKGYGNLVLIRHPNGFVSAYANNGELDVKRGDQVKRGQTIAKSGQSGNVSSPQLHFELRKGAQPVDPTGYLAGL